MNRRPSVPLNKRSFDSASQVLIRKITEYDPNITEQQLDQLYVEVKEGKIYLTPSDLSYYKDDWKEEDSFVSRAIVLNTIDIEEVLNGVGLIDDHFYIDQQQSLLNLLPDGFTGDFDQRNDRIVVGIDQSKYIANTGWYLNDDSVSAINLLRTTTTYITLLNDNKVDLSAYITRSGNKDPVIAVSTLDYIEPISN